MTKRKKESYTIGAVERALRILQGFIDGNSEARVVELAREVGLTKNTTFRMLATMETFGFIRQDAEGGVYRLGRKALDLGQAYLDQVEQSRVLKDAAAALRDAFGETVAAYEFIEGHLSLTHVSETAHPVRVACPSPGDGGMDGSLAGRLFHAYANAEAPPPANRRSGAAAKTGLGNRTVNELIRSQGYLLDDGLWSEEVRGIGAAVFNIDGDVTGCLHLMGPAYRLGMQWLEREVKPALLEAAALASWELGCRKSMRTTYLFAASPAREDRYAEAAV